MTRPTPAVRAPSHLSKPAGELYRRIVSDYELEAHHLAVLVKALEAWDRAEQARALIDRDGLLVMSRLGEPKAHALAGLERDSRAQFGTLTKQLGLDIEGPPPPSARRQR